LTRFGAAFLSLVVVGILCFGALSLGATKTAHAQVGFGQPPIAPPGGPPPAGPGAAQGPPPGTGAATGVPEGQQLPTEAATLPEEPLAIPPAVAKRIGTSDDGEHEKGREPETEHDFYGLYYRQRSGEYEFQTLFPLWLERTQPNNDRASLYGPLYFQRRSEKVDQDILFPFFWKLRDEKTYTTIIGPWMHQETEAGGEETPSHQNLTMAAATCMSRPC